VKRVNVPTVQFHSVKETK